MHAIVFEFKFAGLYHMHPTARTHPIFGVSTPIYRLQYMSNLVVDVNSKAASPRGTHAHTRRIGTILFGVDGAEAYICPVRKGRCGGYVWLSSPGESLGSISVTCGKSSRAGIADSATAAVIITPSVPSSKEALSVCVTRLCIFRNPKMLRDGACYRKVWTLMIKFVPIELVSILQTIYLDWDEWSNHFRQPSTLHSIWDMCPEFTATRSTLNRDL
jgi:hypothetical protein